MKRLHSYLLAVCVVLACLPFGALSSDVFSPQNNNTWTCTVCGKTGNRGSNCPSCGARKPAPWTCPVCGKRGNYNNFCSSCGARRPGGNTHSGYYLILQKVSGDVVSYHAHEGTEIRFGHDGFTVESDGGMEEFSLEEVQRAVYGRSSGTKGKRTEPDYSEETRKALFVYRNDGHFNAFMQSNILSISHSGESVNVHAVDSTYKIPYSAIDSVSFHGLETIYSKDVVMLDQYIPYVASAAGMSISFDKSLPSVMAVKPGDILLYEKIDDHFPNGFAARVLYVENKGGYACTCVPVGIEEVYEQLLLFGEYSASSVLPSMNIQHGALEMSATGDVVPSFSVSIVRRRALPTNVMVSAGARYSISAKLDGETDGDGAYVTEKSRTMHLLPYMPLPGCPAIGVGMDVCLSANFNAKGSLTTNVIYSGSFCVEGMYNGGLSASPIQQSQCCPDSAAALLEGTVTGDVCLMPHVGVAGNFVNFEPAMQTGPEVASDLDLEGLLGGAGYEALKDSKLAVSLNSGLSARFRCGISGQGLELSLQPVSSCFKAKEWHYLPLFTVPDCNELGYLGTMVSTIPSRELLMPVEVGIDIMTGEEVVQQYADSTLYPSPEGGAVINLFTGLERGKEYKACPSVNFAGMHMQASPASAFYLEPEAVTFDLSEVTDSSAVR